MTPPSRAAIEERLRNGAHQCGLNAASVRGEGAWVAMDRAAWTEAGQLLTDALSEIDRLGKELEKMREALEEFGLSREDAFAVGRGFVRVQYVPAENVTLLGTEKNNAER